MVFEEKIYFWFMAVLLVILLLFLSVRIWKKRAQKKFASPEMLKKLSPDRSLSKPFIKAVLLLLSFACLVLALVNPKTGSDTKTVKSRGVDIVFALDVSRSMLAEDIAPNRLEKAKRLISETINHLDGDRVGIIGYAGSAFPQVPITTDYSTAKIFLQSMNTNMVSSQGTAIRDAIHLASTYYSDNEKISRLLFIFSDGEDHKGGLENIAEEAAQKGIQIYTIGLGSVEGGPIPIKKNGKLLRYLKNNQGETVITKLHPETLKRVANSANGKYMYGGTTSEVVKEIEQILENATKSAFSTKKYADYASQFQWLIGFALFFLLLEVFFLERKTSWLQKLNLFNEKRT